MWSFLQAVALIIVSPILQMSPLALILIDIGRARNVHPRDTEVEGTTVSPD